MTSRENSDLLRLVFPLMRDDWDGYTYTFQVHVSQRDFDAHRNLRDRDFKFNPETQGWIPLKKGFLLEFEKEEFDTFRDVICQFLSEGYLLYSISAPDLCQWLKELHLWEAPFAIRSRRSRWQEKLLQCSNDFEVSNLRHDGRFYLGKIFAWQNRRQMEEYQNFGGGGEDQPTLFELDGEVIH